MVSMTVATLVAAQGEPLRIVVQNFYPPFIMQGGNNRLYGFDINLIENICKRINRDCSFKVVLFKNLLSEVENNRADIAISGITITMDRAKRVNFSLPYLVSTSRFLAQSALTKEPFSLQALANKRIGIKQGSIFDEQIKAMGIKSPVIKYYDTTQRIIDALSEDKIDLALVDNPSAVFWQIQSSGSLKAYGEPFKSGFGYGIAVNKQNEALLGEINQALLSYQNSEDFKTNYQQFMSGL